eukprot:6351414-Pyramimonas_sp.AAC.1
MILWGARFGGFVGPFRGRLKALVELSWAPARPLRRPSRSSDRPYEGPRGAPNHPRHRIMPSAFGMIMWEARFGSPVGPFRCRFWAVLQLWAPSKPAPKACSVRQSVSRPNCEDVSSGGSQCVRMSQTAAPVGQPVSQSI